jgi:hypothetical protein
MISSGMDMRRTGQLRKSIMQTSANKYANTGQQAK